MNEQRTNLTGQAAQLASLQAEMAGILRLIAETDKRYEQRFLSQEKAVASALAAAEKAVGVAEQNAEKWRTNANEWRGAMNDRESKFVMKDTLQPAITSLQKEVDELKTQAMTSMGKGAGLSAAWGYLIQIVGLMAALGVGLYIGK